MSDLCFRDEVETYLEIRKKLEGLADVFVVLMHNGNSNNANEASEITRKINEAYPDGVHLVAAGHTHFIHDNLIAGTHVMQDGAQAKNFGRVDLFWDPAQKKILSELTQSKAGIPINPTDCNEGKNSFYCDQYSRPIQNHPAIESLIQALHIAISPLADKKIAFAKNKIFIDRISESPLANTLTDALRMATQTDISFMNTGGIRTSLLPGEITYEKFFAVLPFANRVVVLKDLSWKSIKKLLDRTITTCGQFGALMQSGLKIIYSRTCKPGEDLSKDARLISVSAIDGEILFDEQHQTPDERTFKVATLDFLASGGEHFDSFQEAKTQETLGIARDIIAEELIKENSVLTQNIDHRFFNQVDSK